ncbi:hypothetical protein [Frankia sp. AgW1.1]|uniref:hypothetical protein n=1 Tax=Frankia sp. AgW1.1 TaxID=1836971 RepID=UPI001933499B|nr:hypothetical protein [Frankia sp. AgW1.1]MBL7487158.1 hypothetical protein [Frankia sp. AgW1.1]
MAERKTFLYRLDVVYPEGAREPDGSVNGEWSPAGWDYNPENEWVGREPHTGDEEWGVRDFRWPRRRNFLSREGAEAQAERLRSYGAAVAVVRSEPVAFSDQNITPTDLDQVREILSTDVDCSPEHRDLLNGLVHEVAAMRAQPVRIAAEGRKVRHLLDLLVSELPSTRAAAFRRALANPEPSGSEF